MRLIDADALYDEYLSNMQELVKSTNHEHVDLDALSLLCGAKLITDAKTVNGWISVKDKKRPLLGSLVIVCLQDEKTQRVRMSYYDKYKGIEIWSDMPVGFEVTHWAPLPEPPKEETDANSV